MRVEYFFCYKTSLNEYIWKYKPSTKNNSLFVLGELRRHKDKPKPLRIIAVDGSLIYITTGHSSKSNLVSNVFYVEGFIVSASNKYILNLDKEKVYESFMAHIKPYLLSEDEHQNDRYVSMNLSVDEVLRMSRVKERGQTNDGKLSQGSKKAYVHTIFDDLIS